MWPFKTIICKSYIKKQQHNYEEGRFMLTVQLDSLIV